MFGELPNSEFLDIALTFAMVAAVPIGSRDAIGADSAGKLGTTGASNMVDYH